MTAAAEFLLSAGAVLPAGTELAAADAALPVAARVYRHPAIGDRVVVRLVPAALGAAEDLTMEVLGFGADPDPVEVGLVKTVALGFPAWAVVNDPANARHALALAKDVEKLSRLALTRTGAARDGFVALAERLARAVPHFLPTFWEEAGRAFSAAESNTYAAAMFGKAREAERSFGLVVDEERQHAVFLEFAFTGALTAKELAAHAKQLQERLEPGEALARFQRLCVERTLGGLAPYAGMRADIQRLAKAAKAPADDVDDEIVAELLSAPALSRAAGAFWAGYRPALVRAAWRDRAVIARLAEIFPLHWPEAEWIAFLIEAGVGDALTETVTPGREPSELCLRPGVPAAWLTGMTRCIVRFRDSRTRSAALLELAGAMADRLVADGVPVDLTSQWRVPLDLVDLLLARGVPLAEVKGSDDLDVDVWLQDEAPGHRDLAAVAASEPLRRRLAKGIEWYLNRVLDGDKHQATVRRVAGTPGLRTALTEWLDDLATAVTSASLADIDQQLGRLRLISTPAGLAVNPAAIEKITSHELASTLARTLRGGILDEFGWPGIEQVVKRLAGQSGPGGAATTGAATTGAATTGAATTGAATTGQVQVWDQWPTAVVRQGDFLIAVEPDGSTTEHVMRIPADQRRYLSHLAVRFVDGQFLVSWDRGPDNGAYWTGDPANVFTIPNYVLWDAPAPGSLPVPGGGRTWGDAPLRPGDRAERRRPGAASDGRDFWAVSHEEPPGGGAKVAVWRELDPATGELGRATMPGFFTGAMPDSARLDPIRCWLKPAPDALRAGPLGWRDGLVGARCYTMGDTDQVAETVDGRGIALPKARLGSADLAAVLTFPGSQAGVGMAVITSWNSNAVELWSADAVKLARLEVGAWRPELARGTPVVPPAAFWTHLTPRDPTGSAALRAVTDEAAAGLLRDLLDLARATSGTEAERAVAVSQGLCDLVAAALPEISDENLSLGVVGVVWAAGLRAQRLTEVTLVLTDPAAAGSRAARDASAPEPVCPSRTAHGLMPWSAGGFEQGARVIRALGAALTGPAVPEGPVAELRGIDRDWLELPQAVAGLMYRLVSPATPADHRRTIAALLPVCAASGLFAPGASTRTLALAAPLASAPAWQQWQVLSPGADRRLIITGRSEQSAAVAFRALEFSADGEFGAIPGVVITHAEACETFGVTSGMIETILGQYAEHGVPEWPGETWQRLADAAGLPPSQAVLLVSGLATIEALLAVRDLEDDPEDEAGDAADAADEAGDAAGDAGDAEDAKDGEPGSPPLVLPAGCGRARLTSSLKNVAPDHATARRRLAALLPRDPADLWTAGPDIESFAAGFIAEHGRRTPPPEDLVETFTSLGAGFSATFELITGLTNPATCRWLETPWSVLGGSDDRHLATAVSFLAWAGYTFRPDDPLRPVLAEAAVRLASVSRDPRNRIDIGYLDQTAKPVEDFAAALGLRVEPATDGADVGPFYLPSDARRHQQIYLILARLESSADPVLTAAAGMTHVYLRGDRINLSWLDTLRGPGLPVALSGPIGTAGEPRDPQVSAADLVAEVSAALGLTAAEAALYLQLLALPDPTDRNVAAWTGWKPARLKAARAGLAATDLVLEAKRARAGRSLFLPGGWLALKAPQLPVEEWKAPLLTMDAEGNPWFGVIVPREGAPAAFRTAWERHQSGDAPGFEKLTTGGRR